MNVRDRRFIEQVTEALLVLARLLLGVPPAQFGSGLRRESLEDQQLLRGEGHRQRVARVQMSEYHPVLGFQRRADITVDAQCDARWKGLVDIPRVVAELPSQNGGTGRAGSVAIKILGELPVSPARDRAHPLRCDELAGNRLPHVQRLGEMAQQRREEILAHPSRSLDEGAQGR